MKQTNYWATQVTQPFIHKAKDVPAQASVVIVGAGISGLSTAWHMLKEGIDVVVCERNTVGEGSTVKSAGFLTNEPGRMYADIIYEKGFEYTKKLSQTYYSGLQYLEQWIRDEKIDCDLAITDTIQFGTNNRSAIWASEEFDAKKTLGLKVELMKSGSMRHKFPFIDGKVGLRTPYNASMNPAKFIHALATVVQDMGGIILENSKVTELIEKKGKWVVKLEHGEILANTVSINVDTELADWHEELQPSFNIVETVAVTKPIKKWNGWEKNELLWNTYDLFEYARPLPDGRIFFGTTQSADIDTGTDPYVMPVEEMQEIMDTFFTHMLIQPEIEYMWSGSFGVTGDELPFIDKMPNGQLVAGGYNGHGLVLGFLSGDILTHKLLGKAHPSENLFTHDRKLGFRNTLFTLLPAQWMRTIGLRTVLSGYRLKDRFMRRSS